MNDVIMPIGSPTTHEAEWDTTNYHYKGKEVIQKFENLDTGLIVEKKTRFPERQQVRDRSKYNADGSLK